MTSRVTRRRCLLLAGASTGVAALAACGATPTPQIIKEVVTQIVEGTPQVVTETVVVKETVVVEKEVTAAPKAEEAVTLTVAIAGEPNDLEENFKPFLETHPNYTLKVIGIPWAEFDTKVALMVSGGEPPAVIYPNASKTPMEYAMKGLVLAIDPYLERDSYDMSGFFNIDPDGVVLGGQRYGIPVASFPEVVAYNKDLFAEAAVSEPPTDWQDKDWNWDEFIVRSQALTVPDSDPMKAVWGWGGGMNLRYASLDFGVDIWKPEDYGTMVPKSSLVASDLYQWFLQNLQDFIWKHQIQPSPEQEASFAAAVPEGAFISGKAGMVTAPPWVVSGLKDLKFQWSLAPFPGNENGGYRGILYVGFWSMFKVANQDAAWELLKFCVSEEGMEKAVDLLRAGRGNSVTQGGIPTRKSVADKHIAAMAEAIGKAPEDLKLVSEAIEYCHIFPAAATTVFGQIWDVAMAPYFDQILLNKITVAEAAAQMDVKVNEILAQLGA
ncbi:MAG: extracellular solute-binding protein [Anaerolineae bacterium]